MDPPRWEVMVGQSQDGHTELAESSTPGIRPEGSQTTARQPGPPYLPGTGRASLKGCEGKVLPLEECTVLKTLLLIAFLTAPPTLEERVANLETQIQAVESIPVPADLRDEREARITALRVELHGADIADVSKGR